MSGKGDRPRPLGIDKDKFNDNWDSIFKDKKKPKLHDSVDLYQSNWGTKSKENKPK